MRLGYIMFSSSPECKEDDINKLEMVKCDKIFVDQPEHEKERPQWRKMLSEVRRNDEIVILKLSNAIKELVAVASFFEICRVKKVRIISLKDKFDSLDEMFPSSTAELVNAIGSFPGDILSLKMSSEYACTVRKKKSSFQTSKEEREKRCVDLYNNRTSIEDIKEEVGFRSNSSVYRILKNKGVKVNRRIIKGTSEE